MGAIGLLWWFVANEGLLLWLTCFGLCCLRGWLYAIKTRGQIKSNQNNKDDQAVKIAPKQLINQRGHIPTSQ